MLSVYFSVMIHLLPFPCVYVVLSIFTVKMRASIVSMGKHFGNLGKVCSVVGVYVLSFQMYGEHRFALAPNEQKAFKGFFDQAVVNVSCFTSSFFVRLNPIIV